MVSSICISSGHSLLCQGAVGILNEVDEARRVVDRVAEELDALGVEVMVFHDNESKTQNENLEAIVDYHNEQFRDLDVSVHFNAFEDTASPMGTETLYLTAEDLAAQMSYAISTAGAFIDRGPKPRDDLFFLNNTSMPAILIEVCFVDSEHDVALYEQRFDEICRAIAHVLADYDEDKPAPPRPEPDDDDYATVVGTCSHFGGPNDTGVAAGEGLAFIYGVDEAPHLFLPGQPAGTTGLARRLNPYVHYIAMRWDYDKHPKSSLLGKLAFVRNPRTGFGLTAFPADWGPNEATGRIADLSPGLMDDLELETDDEVEVTFPYEED